MYSRAEPVGGARRLKDLFEQTTTMTQLKEKEEDESQR
jgi:hypothetical protein